MNYWTKLMKKRKEDLKNADKEDPNGQYNSS